MTQPGEEFDPELMFRETRAQFDQIADLEKSMSAFKGLAESPDGRVRVTYTQDKGLADVQLDPRAMRMSAAELGELIVQVSGEAKRDLERQIKELMDESFAQQDLTPDDLKNMFDDPGGVSETLGAMGQIFQGATKEIEGMLDQVRRAMGTAASGGAPPASGNAPPTPPPPQAPQAPPTPPWAGPGESGGQWPWGGGPPPTPGGAEPWPWGGKPPEGDDEPPKRS